MPFISFRNLYVLRNHFLLYVYQKTLGTETVKSLQSSLIPVGQRRNLKSWFSHVKAQSLSTYSGFLFIAV